MDDWEVLSSAYLCCLIQWHLIEVFAFLVWEVLLTHFFEQWALACIEIWSEWRNNLVEMIKEFAQIKAWLQTYLSWTHESLADCRCGHALVACHGGGHGAMRSFSLLMTHFQHKASSRPGARSPASPPSWLWSLELWTMMKFMVDKKLWSQPDMQAKFLARWCFTLLYCALIYGEGFAAKPHGQSGPHFNEKAALNEPFPHC